MPYATPPNLAQTQVNTVDPGSVVQSSRPHPWELALHPVKGVRFVGSLAADRRINMFVKIAYVGVLIVLLIAMLAPEGLLAVLLAAVLPFIGPAVNIPADAVVDWLALGLAAYGLLGIFPRAIVSEHHARLFHPGRVARAQRDHPTSH